LKLATVVKCFKAQALGWGFGDLQLRPKWKKAMVFVISCLDKQGLLAIPSTGNFAKYHFGK
jgi:hypothetical protein